jgi:hypothetical protein
MPSMCDYSLHSVRSRAARAGDKLVIASFAYTATRGLAGLGEPGVAVCLRPGTELAFEEDVKWGSRLFVFFRKRRPSGRLVRFRQVNMVRTDTHHDAVEFPDGEVVLLTDLHLGQKATVVQLPVSRSATEQDASNNRVSDRPGVVPADALRVPCRLTRSWSRNVVKKEEGQRVKEPAAFFQIGLTT